MNIENLPFTSHSLGGIELAGKIFSPENPREDCVIFFLHDLGDHTGRYQNFFLFITKHLNARLLTFDFVGHGLSSGPRAHLEDISDLKVDLANFIKKSQEMYPSATKKIMIGQGLGALVILDYFFSFKDEREKDDHFTVLINPYIQILFSFPWWVKKMMGFSSPSFPSIRFPLHHFNELRFSEVRARNLFLSDPLNATTIDLSTLQNLLEQIRRIRALAYYWVGPSLFLISQGNKISDSNSVNIFVKSIAKGEVKKILYEVDEHDLLNDRSHQQVYTDIRSCLYNWLDEQAPTTPTPPSPPSLLRQP